MLREIEWVGGAVALALLAVGIIVASVAIESPAVRLVVFAAAGVLAAVAATVANTWGYAVPPEGWPKSERPSRARVAYERLRERDWLVGVEVLWAVAALALVAVALGLTIAPLLLPVGLVGLIAAVGAIIWGDVVGTAVAERRPPA